MTTQTTKVKNGAILLPLKLRKSWKGAAIFVRASDETIVIKKIKKTPFWKTWEKMQKISKRITQKDIENAIVWARKSKN